MSKVVQKKIQVFEGLTIPAGWWLSIVLLADAAQTLLGFTIGFDSATGKNPLFGIFGVIILTIIKNWFGKLQEWKAKNESPPDSIKVVTTETTPKSTTISETTVQ